MSKGQKIVTIALWTILVVVMLGVLGAAAWDQLQNRGPNKGRASTTRGADESLGLFDAPAFSLTDQDGKTVTDKELRGHPYVASFVFTQCAGPCPLITAKVASLQKRIENPKVKFVSFTVDPEHDTPAVLKQYAKRFDADPTRWTFLTGEPKAVYAAIEGMKMALQPASGQEPIIHSTRLLLIDGQGKCRGVYDGGENADPEALNNLARDAKRFAR